MFFFLSKTLGLLVLPSNLLLLLGLLGVLLMRGRWFRLGQGLAVVSLVVMAVCGFSPLGNALMLPLEDRFAVWDPGGAAPDGIVVLGGSFDNEVSAARGEVALNESAERLTKAVELARRYPNAKLIFSGGHGQMFGGGPTEAELAVRLFEDLGLDRRRIAIEDQSRDTAENARLTKVLAAPRDGEHWLLVTSAHHMPRAVAAFRQAGFLVEAYPVDWRLRGMQDLFRPFTVASDGLKRCDAATREWIGLIAYRLSGRSAELLPAPAPPIGRLDRGPTH